MQTTGLLMTVAEIIAQVYIIFLLMRWVLSERYFQFNPSLQSIYNATEPLLDAIRQLARPIKGYDYSPPIAVALVVLAKSVVFYLVEGRGMPFLAVGLQQTQWLVDFLAVLLLGMLAIALLIPAHTGNVFVVFIHQSLGMLLGWLKRLVGSARTSYLLGIGGVVLLHALASFGLALGVLAFGAALGIDTRLVPLNALSGQVVLKTLMLGGSLLRGYSTLLFLRIIMSWVSPDPSSPIVSLIIYLTEPAMRPFRRIIPPLGGLDFSPILLFLVLGWISNMYERYVGLLVRMLFG